MFKADLHNFIPAKDSQFIQAASTAEEHHNPEQGKDKRSRQVLTNSIVDTKIDRAPFPRMSQQTSKRRRSKERNYLFSF